VVQGSGKNAVRVACQVLLIGPRVSRTCAAALGAAAAFHLKPDNLALAEALASQARILDLPPRTMRPKRYA
jgi:hypothetical protein